MFAARTYTVTLKLVSRALSEKLPDEDADSIATRAKTLTAIAAGEGVPIELLIRWIHIRVPSDGEWRVFCAKYKAMRDHEKVRQDLKDFKAVGIKNDGVSAEGSDKIQ